MNDLIGVERLRKHVVAAEVQHFGPKRFIGEAIHYNQRWRCRCTLQVDQDIFPFPTSGKAGFGQNYGDGGKLGRRQPAKAVNKTYLPVLAVQDFFE